MSRRAEIYKLVYSRLEQVVGLREFDLDELVAMTGLSNTEIRFLSRQNFFSSKTS